MTPKVHLEDDMDDGAGCNITGEGETKNLGFKVGGGAGGVSSATRVMGGGFADTIDEGVTAGIIGMVRDDKDIRRWLFEKGGAPRRCQTRVTGGCGEVQDRWCLDRGRGG
jgi:hypothetical protein